MTYLLDVNALIAVLWTDHSDHEKADAWLKGKQVALCPLSELGFLRISSHPKGLGAPMADAEKLLGDFVRGVSPQFVPADLSASRLGAPRSDSVTDLYLAKLAEAHAMKLATLDSHIAHSAVELIREDLSAA